LPRMSRRECSASSVSRLVMAVWSSDIAHPFLFARDG
jgi:hypothetical protein